MDVKLPQLAEGVESGTVVSIMVAEGQEVKKDQAIMELETQKAVGSIPAPSSGIVTKIYVKQGMEVAVGQALIAIESSGTASAASAKPPQAPATTEVPPAKPTTPPQTQPATTAMAVENYNYESKSGAPPPAPPSVRKIARDLGIDLTKIKGSEAGGRINLGDLRDYVQRLQQIAFHSAAPTAQPAPASAPTPAPSEADVKTKL
jgi:pyruvate dehydrogenase E2 component (dihydrolipoamide acetyltransferase)